MSPNHNRILSVLGVSLLAAAASCGSDKKPQVDAAVNPGVDAMVDAAVDAPPDAPTLVRTVTCPANPNELAATVTTSSFMFLQSTTTIPVGAIVQFTTESFHNVIPHPTLPSDPGLSSGFGQTKCLQFTAAGEFNWRCQPHASMTGVFTVQ